MDYHAVFKIILRSCVSRFRSALTGEKCGETILSQNALILVPYGTANADSAPFACVFAFRSQNCAC